MWEARSEGSPVAGPYLEDCLNHLIDNFMLSLGIFAMIKQSKRLMTNDVPFVTPDRDFGHVGIPISTTPALRPCRFNQ
jgi:hypothetical protein